MNFLVQIQKKEPLAIDYRKVPVIPLGDSVVGEQVSRESKRTPLLSPIGGPVILPVDPSRIPIVPGKPNTVPSSPLPSGGTRPTKLYRAPLDLDHISGLNGRVSPATCKVSDSLLRSAIETIAHLVELFAHSRLMNRRVPFSKANVVEKTLYHWRLCVMALGGEEVHAMKFVKRKLADYVAYHISTNPDEQQELPPPLEFKQLKGVNFQIADHPHTLLSGSGNTTMSALLRSSTPARRREFLISILLSKKAIQSPSEQMLKDALVGTFKDLTVETKTPLMVDWRGQTVTHECKCGRGCTLNHLTSHVNDPTHCFYHEFKNKAISQWTMEHQFRRSVKELFKKKHGRTHIIDWFKAFLPSTSANYTDSRTGLGMAGDIVKFRDMVSGTTASDHVDSETNEKRLRHISTVTENKEDDLSIECDELFELFDTSLESYTPVPQAALLCGCGCQGVYQRAVLDPTVFESRFEKLMTRVRRMAYKQSPRVKLVALAEALKVRVISKGPKYMYMALRPLQKLLWRVLAQHPVFELTGTPVTEEILTKTLRSLLPGERWVSADYEAATNRLKSWVSDAIISELSFELKLSEQDTDIFFKAMTKHLIQNPEGREYAQQVNGQLMGSIVSFPILCIANAAICRFVMERASPTGKVIPLRKARILINGDDAAFPTTPWGFSYWKVVASFCGLSPSIGKVYFSSEFVNLNSTNFEYTDGKFSLTHYVNMGLFVGKKRSQGVSTQDSSDEAKQFDYSADPRFRVGTLMQELKKLCPSDLWKAVCDGFKVLHLKTLQSTSLPWAVPQRLGGLGCVPQLTLERDGVEQYGFPISDLDRRVASYIMLNWGPRCKAVPVSATQKMVVRQTVLREIPLPEKETHDEEEIKRSNNITQMYCVAELLRKLTLSKDKDHLSEVEIAKNCELKRDGALFEPRFAIDHLNDNKATFVRMQTKAPFRETYRFTYTSFGAQWEQKRAKVLGKQDRALKQNERLWKSSWIKQGRACLPPPSSYARMVGERLTTTVWDARVVDIATAVRIPLPDDDAEL